MKGLWRWLYGETVEFEPDAYATLLAEQDTKIDQLTARVNALEKAALPVPKKTFPVGPLILDWEEAERRNLAKLEELDGAQSKRR